MNFIKHVFLSLLCSVTVYAMDFDWHKLIDENQNSPEALKQILTQMPRYTGPDLTAAKRILDMGISPNTVDRGDILKDNPGSGALTTAAFRGETEYVKLLLDYGADTEIKCPWNGQTALMKASMEGHSDTVVLLIQRGAHVNACQKFGDMLWTSLACAARAGHMQSVKLLLDAGALISIANINGKTALTLTKESRCENENRIAIIQLLKTKIIDQAEGAIVLARAYSLPLDVWKKIVANLDLENMHKDKLITYLSK